MFFRRKGGPQTPRGRIAAGIVWLILLVPLVMFTIRARNWLFGAILAAVGYLIVRYTLEEVPALREECEERLEGEEDEDEDQQREGQAE